MEQTLDIAAVPVLETEAALFDYTQCREAADVLRAINNDFRKQILELLNRHKQLTVTDIFVKLRIDQSVASQHLSVLRSAKLVNTTRDGKYIHYSVNHDRVEHLKHIIQELAN
jgi:DNA-binding transcriptional ArsR family regulator